MADNIILNGEKFGLEELVSIARHGKGVSISIESKSRIHKARALIDKWVKDGYKVRDLGYVAQGELTVVELSHILNPQLSR